MSRLSIELTPEQHQRIKAVAALNGCSIRDYVLDRVLPLEGEQSRALNDLKAFLAPRLEEAKAGIGAHTTAQKIFQETLSE